jgi:histidine ammonia-lyase
MTKLELDGSNLSPEDVHAFVVNPKARVSIARGALAKVKKTHAFLLSAAENKVTYGVNTGLGPMASHIIGRGQLRELQYNLVRSHASGVGEPLPERFVLAAMLDRLNTLAKGYSGVSPEVISQLEFFINNRITSIVPEHGAVGTSGDLVQLAHIALSLIGEGECLYNGKRQLVSSVLSKLRRKPLVLGPKEGLALMNGTSVMTGIAALLVVDARRTIEIALRSGALALELVHAFPDAFDETLQKVRPHKGQKDVAAALRALLQGSQTVRDRTEFQSRIQMEEKLRTIPEDVQEVYSFRCMPQILGPVLDALRVCRDVVAIELNSVTDNPIVDVSTKRFLHGGNFHGDYIAVAMDQLKISMVKLSLLSERRINFFLNKNVNRSYPAFLNLAHPGLTLALQGMQFVATSTAAHNQSLAYPHSLHTISTNADNQDVVSMGTDAALIASRVMDNTFYLLALELATLAQAVEVAKIEKALSEESRHFVKKIRGSFTPVVEDRSLTKELEALCTALRQDPSFSLSVLA